MLQLSRIKKCIQIHCATQPLNNCYVKIIILKQEKTECSKQNFNNYLLKRTITETVTVTNTNVYGKFSVREF